MTTIAKPSLQSLLLVMNNQGNQIGTGTGFVANSSSGPVLITNWHNVSGRNPQNNEPLNPNGVVPDTITIIHNRCNHLGQWVQRTEPLYKNGNPLWSEHPAHGNNVDFVALPLTQLNDVEIYPYSLGINDPQISYGPADEISVIGFPFGIQAGGSLAVWATGFIASEPSIDYNNLPIFLIDCRSRPGQSGSAVISYRNGGTVTMEDGSAAIFNGPVNRFLGIYSGRINAQSDIGIVWKASAIIG